MQVEAVLTNVAKGVTAKLSGRTLVMESLELGPRVITAVYAILQVIFLH